LSVERKIPSVVPAKILFPANPKHVTFENEFACGVQSVQALPELVDVKIPELLLRVPARQTKKMVPVTDLTANFKVRFILQWVVMMRG
jgi:hypothetical protein